jgi:hypothetical protein
LAKNKIFHPFKNTIMNKILLITAFFVGALQVQAQEFTKQATAARTAYTSGKLDDSRFAMQQMLQELDMMTGKEILKILPAQMQDQKMVTGKDEVAGTSGFAGVTIHRAYGTEAKAINLELVTNSPLLGSLNALLSLPFIANSADQKVVKIEGYKALVQKSEGENGTANYELQLPLNNSLITLKAPGYTQDQVIKMASTIPVAQIAKMVQ